MKNENKEPFEIIIEKINSIETAEEFINFLKDLRDFSETDEDVLSENYKEYIDAMWGYALGAKYDLEEKIRDGRIHLRDVAMMLFRSLSQE